MRHFSVPVNFIFILAGALRMFHSVVQMIQFKQDDGLWRHYGDNSTQVAEYYDEKEWLNRGFTIWLSCLFFLLLLSKFSSGAPITFILAGFSILLTFWIDMWRISKTFRKTHSFLTYAAVSSPASLVR